MIKLLKFLNNSGILGINRRNANYILKYNQRNLYPLVDDKLKTKRLALKAGIAVPELYGSVEMQCQIRHVPDLLENYKDFVIKPSHGCGGSGIMVISGRTKNCFKQANGDLISQKDINYHISKIISGTYSFGGIPDIALIEYRVQFNIVFERISYLGVPDIRIIVFCGIPIMAMVRLPTRISNGKANLHQGAIGAGIDINSGKTLTAVFKNSIISEHPDTGNNVTNVQVPGWDNLLHIASRCYDLTGLGYQGVDIILDKNKGALILELNARPGLNIQVANKAGLLSRLLLAEQYYKKLKTPDEKVDFAKKKFSGHVH